MAIQPGAARAPAPSAVSSRNQKTIEAVVSVAAITRTITTTMAQHSAAANAASPARLAKPDAVGFRITSTPARPARIAAQTCPSGFSRRNSAANGTTSSGALSVIA